MKKISIILGTAAILVTAGTVACDSGKNPSKNNEGIAELNGAMDRESMIERGRYLVTIMGCNDCHSPKKMGPNGPELDSTLLLSGHPSKMPVANIPQDATQSWVLFNQNLTAFVGPWGVSFAANITSDATGIGNWTEYQFIKAIREGKFKGLDNARPMLPPMPWQQYRQATDEDLKAIFAYLKSTVPIENIVPGPIPPDQLNKLN